MRKCLALVVLFGRRRRGSGVRLETPEHCSRELGAEAGNIRLQSFHLQVDFAPGGSR